MSKPYVLTARRRLYARKPPYAGTRTKSTINVLNRNIGGRPFAEKAYVASLSLTFCRVERLERRLELLPRMEAPPRPTPAARAVVRSSCLDARDFEPRNRTSKPLTFLSASRWKLAKKRVRSTHFVESGMASASPMAGDMEVGVIGREGMTGLSVVMGGNAVPPHETFIEIAGNGVRIAGDLRKAIGRASPYITPCCAMRRIHHPATSRRMVQQDRRALGRWLRRPMIASTATDSRFTQEFLAIMLGVRRSGGDEDRASGT